ncbi:hypothetical protein SDC9_134719 [bioreactor metagenome]|uniref:Uncharacterized protein n=1 Tax=bioreactor metagenome TaxID=1076179 RepID=A0A645DED0_9ZZZZ
MACIPFFFEHFIDQGRGGGLAVASRHPDYPGRAVFKEYLHFACNLHALLCLSRKLGQIKPKARGFENPVAVQMIQVVFPQMKFHPQSTQFFIYLAQFFFCLFITGSHSGVMLAQDFDQRCVAYADTDHTHFFPRYLPIKRIDLLIHCFNSQILKKCFLSDSNRHKIEGFQI